MRLVGGIESGVTFSRIKTRRPPAHMRKTLAREIEACRRELGALRARMRSAFGKCDPESPSSDEMEVDEVLPMDELVNLSINNHRNSRTTPDVPFTPEERTARAGQFIGTLVARIGKPGCQWLSKPYGTWSLEPTDGSDRWFVYLSTDSITITACVNYLTRSADVRQQQWGQKGDPDRVVSVEQEVTSEDDLHRVISEVNRSLARLRLDQARPNGPPHSP